MNAPGSGDEDWQPAQPNVGRGRHSAQVEESQVPAVDQVETARDDGTGFEGLPARTEPDSPPPWQYIPPPWEPVSPQDVLPVGSFVHYGTPVRGGGRRGRWVGAALVVIVAGAGVAFYISSKHSKGQGSSLPPGSVVSVGSSLPPGTGVAAGVQSIVLQLSDLPVVWTSKPYLDSPSNPADEAAMARCTGARSTDPDIVHTANSDEFTLGSSQISSSASSYRSQTDIAADTALARNPKLQICLNQLGRQQLAGTLPKSDKITSVAVKIARPWAGAPINVIATESGTITMTVNGRKVVVYLTNTLIVGPRIEANVEMLTADAPTDPALLHSLVTTVAARAARG